MTIKIRTALQVPAETSKIFIVPELKALKDFGISEPEMNYLTRKMTEDPKKRFLSFNRLTQWIFILLTDEDKEINTYREQARRHGATLIKLLKEDGYTTIALFDLCGDTALTLALAEGVVLGAYTFSKYKTDAKPEPEIELLVVSPEVTGCRIVALSNLCEAVFLARDLINEPVGHLNAGQLGDVALNLGKKLDIKTEVFNKKKIESLKMGGLLGVNKGSIDPPTFTVMEWKPENAVNQKPYVLVGKGVVFDTGGINLKTVPGSIDTMKCDMSGAASVLGAMSAIAANKLPIYVVGLIPATDNRPGGNAIVPGDILKMHNGTTVEILNTDAEGRLILADALSFSKHYNAELVIDLATLTGSAAMAIGEHGSVAMGTADDAIKDQLTRVGNEVCERVVWFPFWEDYDAGLKSEVADLKNIGGREGGAITAGKFLSRFVEAPWIHLDIAGPAFLTTASNYRGIGGTGTGVRLLYRFLESIACASNCDGQKNHCC
jgi:leucyl aminopeptidase